MILRRKPLVPEFRIQNPGPENTTQNTEWLYVFECGFVTVREGPKENHSTLNNKIVAQNDNNSNDDKVVRTYTYIYKHNYGI